ncbi:MAG: ABC transporter substrate-binding protein [Woeseia sp.]
MTQSAHDRHNFLSKGSPLVLVLAILSSLNQLAAEVPGKESPTLVVDALHDALIEVASRSDSLGYESRFAKLEPAIDASHDFPTIARLVGGRFWRELNDHDRTVFTEAFRRASIATYAARFTSAEGLQFEKSTVQENHGIRARVRSYLTRTDGGPIKFEYVLQLTDEEWRIVTILVDGVSDLALQRAELTRIYSGTGFQGVMEHIEAKAENATDGS